MLGFAENRLKQNPSNYYWLEREKFGDVKLNVQLEIV
jgi:hypothetical protein